MQDCFIEFYLKKINIEKELWVAYQPTVNMITGELVGCEALLRWNSPDLGAVSPDRFIPVAENTGLIFGISEWVFSSVAIQMSKWQKIKKGFSVSVNISPIELNNNNLVDSLKRIINTFQLDDYTIGIEVTERGIYGNLDNCLNTLIMLQKCNIIIKLDDFGTGQSGLQRLLKFSFQEVKVDRYFVPSSKNDKGKIAVCRIALELSIALNFSIIIEGVETQDQMNLLVEMGYIFGQGYYFYRPMPKDKLIELLLNHSQRSL